MTTGLVACSDCGAEISPRALACPRCGAPGPGTLRAAAPPIPATTPVSFWSVAAVMVFGLVLFAIYAPGSDDSKASTPWDKSAASQADRQAALQTAVDANVVSTTDCSQPGPAQLRVRPDFAGITFTQKNILATALLEYCFQAGDEYGYVEVRDDRTGMKIGHLAQADYYRDD